MKKITYNFHISKHQKSNWYIQKKKQAGYNVLPV